MQELSNDVSFVILEHQTWDLEGGKIDPPSISWFSSTRAEIGLIKWFMQIMHCRKINDVVSHSTPMIDDFVRD